MKLKTSVVSKLYWNEFTEEVILPGYWDTEGARRDLARVIEYHQLKYEKYKTDYIKKWGEEGWNRLIARDRD